MKQITLIVVIVLLNICGKTWRCVPEYYKSLVYVSFVNAFYYCLCRRHLVWEFTPHGINWKLLRAVHLLVVTPLLVLLVLARYPKTLFKQIVHIGKWTAAASLVEYFTHKQNLIQYKHGWNGLWSGLLYIKMFVYSYLFTKKPVCTWFLTLCSTIFFAIKFRIPLKQKHSFSRKFEGLVDLFYHSFLEDII